MSTYIYPHVSDWTNSQLFIFHWLADLDLVHPGRQAITNHPGGIGSLDYICKLQERRTLSFSSVHVPDIHRFLANTVERLIRSIIPVYFELTPEDRNSIVEYYMIYILPRILEDYEEWHQTSRIGCLNGLFYRSPSLRGLVSLEECFTVGSVFSWIKINGRIDCKRGFWGIRPSVDLTIDLSIIPTKHLVDEFESKFDFKIELPNRN